MVGTGLVDLARPLLGTPTHAYTTVFAIEALVFVISARMAAHVSDVAPQRATRPAPQELRYLKVAE